VNKPESGGVRTAWTLVLISVLALAVRGGALAAEPASPPAGDIEIPSDPQVRTGMLPNGLRFVILRHAAQRHEVSLRLRIAAGSLHEPVDQNGVAHLVEHMAFRGSTHVAESEIWRTLARLGVAFGADSNAFTVASQTYFQFDLPESDDASVGAGLMLMREIAGELTLSPMAVDDERNVVLAEIHLTDSPSAQADRAQTAFWFENQPAAQHDAIGDPDVVKHIRADQLRAFYDAYYRPERTSLLVVGDVDPDAVEAQIRGRFSDWIGKGPPGADPVIIPPRAEGPKTAVFVQPGAPSSIRLAWIAPEDAQPRSLAAARRRLLDELTVRVLNRRLTSQDGRCLVVGASRQSHALLGEVALLTADCQPGQWRAGLQSLEGVRRQILKYGVDQGEVDREAGETLHAWQIAAAAANTASIPAVANALVARIDNGRSLASPGQDLAVAEAVYAKASAAEVDAAMRDLFRGAGPLVFLSSPQPVADGQETLARALADVESSPIAGPARAPRAGPAIWPYTYFGPSGAVAERREIADLGTSFIRFENGVRLTVKPTTFNAGQILVQVAVGDGRLDLPRDRMSADWAADSGAIDAGGLKAMDRADMRRALGASVYSFSFSTGDDSFNLLGLTRPADLDTQLQVLAAYVTAPGWRPGVFEHIQSLFTALLPQFEASPGGVLGDYVGGLLHAGDPRWAGPTMGDVAAARPRDLRTLLERPLADGAVEVTMVGDVSVERAVQAVAATFGALPPRPVGRAPPQDAYQARFPAPTASPVVRFHGGHADQALALAAWPTSDAYARAPNLADMRVLEQVLNNRLIERLRIADGATYTPRAGLEASRVFPGFGYLFAAASVSPAQTDLVFLRISAIAADLRATAISADELERARRPALAAEQRAQENDGYWLNALSRAQTDPRRLDLIRAALPDLHTVTAAGVQRAAQTYLRDETVWKLVIAPPTRGAP